jgi:hypothetical protein
MDTGDAVCAWVILVSGVLVPTGMRPRARVAIKKNGRNLTFCLDIILWLTFVLFAANFSIIVAIIP